MPAEAVFGHITRMSSKAGALAWHVVTMRRAPAAAGRWHSALIALACLLLAGTIALGFAGDLPLDFSFAPTISLSQVGAQGWIIAHQWVGGGPRILAVVNARTGAWRALWPTQQALLGDTAPLAAASPWSPAYASRTRTLAFDAAGPDGAQAIWIAQIDRGRDGWPQVAPAGPQVLVPDCSPCGTLAWSPDGDVLLYDGRSGLMALSVASGATRQITFQAGDDWPACSPDGDWLAYQRARASRGDIVVLPSHDCLPVTTSSAGRRYLVGYAPAWRPSWSPHGHVLAFVSNATGLGRSAGYVTALQALARQPSFWTRTPVSRGSTFGCTDPVWVPRAYPAHAVVVFACDAPDHNNHHGSLLVVPGTPDASWQAPYNDGILARDGLCWMPG